MTENLQTRAEATRGIGAKLRGVDWEWWAILRLWLAVGAPFLSAVADRFELWGKYGG